jgi:hypothetical protein
MSYIRIVFLCFYIGIAIFITTGVLLWKVICERCKNYDTQFEVENAGMTITIIGLIVAFAVAMLSLEKASFQAKYYSCLLKSRTELEKKIEGTSGNMRKAYEKELERLSLEIEGQEKVMTVSEWDEYYKSAVKNDGK